MDDNPTVSESNLRSVSDKVEVVDVHHWTEELFSFRLKRPQSFRFKSGEFVMIGLEKANNKQVLRAYSIASPSWDDTLLFYSIKVKQGALTSQLKNIKPGDQVILKQKPTGTLILDSLKAGTNIFLFSTGTGIAPFASLIRDPEIYQKFDKIILTHTCRHKSDLAFGQMILSSMKDDPLIENSVLNKLIYYPTLTRERGDNMGRITDLIISGTFFSDIGVQGMNPVEDRAMLCGSQGFNKEMKFILLSRGLEEGSINAPGDFVLEKAFAE